MSMNDPYNYMNNQGTFKNIRTEQTKNNTTHSRPLQAMPSNGDLRNMEPNGRTMPAQTANQIIGRTMPPMPAQEGLMQNNQMQPRMVNEVPTTVESTYYTAGILRKYIGENVRVEFLIGSTAPLIDRTGILLEVGASYIILRPSDAPENDLICDLYSIKFVNVIR